MEIGEFLFACGLYLSLGLGSIFYGFDLFRKGRFIQNTPTSKIRSAAQGFIEIEGWTKPFGGQPLIAPLSQRSCIWYFYEIEEYRKDGDDSGWVSVVKRTSDDCFIVDDETGVAVIDPDYAEVHESIKQVWHGHNSHPQPGSCPPPRAKGSLISRYITPTFVSGRYRYTEKRIHAGEHIYVIGDFCTQSGSNQISLKELTRDILIEWKKDYRALIKRFDQNGNGSLEPEEWLEAQRTALKEAKQTHRELQAQPDVHIMRKSPIRGYPYIISCKSQKELTHRNRVITLFATFIGIPLSASGFWMLAVRFM
jgi:hypothetical protein